MSKRRQVAERDDAIAELLYAALAAPGGIALRVQSKELQMQAIALLREVRKKLGDPNLASLTFRRAPGEGNESAIWICKVAEGQ